MENNTSSPIPSLNKKLKPIKSDIGKIKKDTEKIIEKKLKPIRKDISYIKKSVDILVATSDERTTILERKVKLIENHLDITQN